MAGWHLATVAPVGMVHNCYSTGRQHTSDLLKVGCLIERRHVHKTSNDHMASIEPSSMPGRSLPDQRVYWMCA